MIFRKKKEKCRQSTYKSVQYGSNSNKTVKSVIGVKYCVYRYSITR